MLFTVHLLPWGSPFRMKNKQKKIFKKRKGQEITLIIKVTFCTYICLIAQPKKKLLQFFFHHNA